MKPMPSLIIVIPFIVFSTLLFSCKNDELSRSEAEQLIRANALKTEVREFTIYTGNYSNGEQRVIQYAKKLESLGLAQCQWYGDAFKMAITEKGKQYVVSGKTVDFTYYPNCKVSDLEFGGITGISQQKGSNTALVEYTQSRNITPFGEVLNMRNGPFVSSITLTKYDDGWRINK